MILGRQPYVKKLTVADIEDLMKNPQKCMHILYKDAVNHKVTENFNETDLSSRSQHMPDDL